MIVFHVHGEPAAQGSKRGFVRGGKIVMVEQLAKSRPWRDSVRAAAVDAMDGATNGRLAFKGALITGPVRVTAIFTFTRPKSHYRTGKHAGELRPNAPRHVTRSPDLDKLLRNLGDALSGVVIRDDSQIASWHATKVYGDRAGVRVEIVDLSQQNATEVAA